MITITMPRAMVIPIDEDRITLKITIKTLTIVMMTRVLMMTTMPMMTTKPMMMTMTTATAV